MFIYHGEIVPGAECAIIESLRSALYDPDRFKNLDDYMVWLARSVWRFQGVGLTISGETEAQRCASVVSQLVAHGLLVSMPK